MPLKHIFINELIGCFLSWPYGRWAYETALTDPYKIEYRKFLFQSTVSVQNIKYSSE